MLSPNGSTELYNTLMGNPNTKSYNAIGRTYGSQNVDGWNPLGFFEKRGRSIENALGTTGAAIGQIGRNIGENVATNVKRAGWKQNINDVYKKYGFNSKDDFDNQLYAAEDAGDEERVNQLLNNEAMNNELKAVANQNSAEAKDKADAYNDWRKNSYIGQKINQDRGKFLGSAINTLSTGVDLAGLGANPLSNAIQGGLEGIADELEQSGFENFSGERALQNAGIGALTGAATGAFNKALGKTGLGKRLTPGINALTGKQATSLVGKGISTLGNGAIRGALSGAVGGAVGAGAQSAIAGQDIGQGLQNVAQGAIQGAKGGAVSGAVMSGVNSVMNRTPLMQKINQANQDWQNSGSNFKDRFKNTWESGDSIVARGVENAKVAAPALRDALFGPKESPEGRMGYGNDDSSYTDRGFLSSDFVHENRQNIINDMTFDNPELEDYLLTRSDGELAEVYSDYLNSKNSQAMQEPNSARYGNQAGQSEYKTLLNELKARSDEAQDKVYDLEQKQKEGLYVSATELDDAQKAFARADREYLEAKNAQGTKTLDGYVKAPKSGTPAQDAYARGDGSFSDALNEFIEQGGNITRDGRVINDSSAALADELQNKFGLKLSRPIMPYDISDESVYLSVDNKPYKYDRATGIVYEGGDDDSDGTTTWLAAYGDNTEALTKQRNSLAEHIDGTKKELSSAQADYNRLKAREAAGERSLDVDLAGFTSMRAHQLQKNLDRLQAQADAVDRLLSTQSAQNPGTAQSAQTASQPQSVSEQPLADQLHELWKSRSGLHGAEREANQAAIDELAKQYFKSIKNDPRMKKNYSNNKEINNWMRSAAEQGFDIDKPLERGSWHTSPDPESRWFRLGDGMLDVMQDGAWVGAFETGADADELVRAWNQRAAEAQPSQTAQSAQQANSQLDLSGNKRVNSGTMSANRNGNARQKYIDGFYEMEDSDSQGNNGISNRVIDKVAQAIAEVDPNAKLDGPYEAAYDLIDESQNLSQLKNNLLKHYGAFFSESDVDNILGATAWADDNMRLNQTTASTQPTNPIDEFDFKGSKIDYDDDLVITYDKDGNVVYQGIVDNDPMKNERWKWDEKTHSYKLGGYTQVNANGARKFKNSSKGMRTLDGYVKAPGSTKQEKFNRALSIAKEALSAFETADPYGFEESMTSMAEEAGLNWDTAKGKREFTNKWLNETANDIMGGGDFREMWAKSLEDYVGAPQLENGVNPINGGTVENERLKSIIDQIRRFDDTVSPSKGMKTLEGFSKLPTTSRKEQLTGTGRTLNPDETEIYSALTGEEPNDITEAFKQDVEPISKRNRLQMAGNRIQNEAKIQKFSGLLDSLDAKTAKRAVETDAPQRLLELGVRPQDYEEYAKTSSYVNRVISDLADKSNVRLNAPNLADELSADNLNVTLNDTARRKYDSYIKQIVPDGSSPAELTAGYALEASRWLGDKAAKVTGSEAKDLRQALTEAKYTLRDKATNALDVAGVTGELTTDNIANGLKQLGANDAVADYYTNAIDGREPNAADFIRRSSLFEQARDMGIQAEAEKYTRSASKQPKGVMAKLYSASGLEAPINSLLKNTVAPVAAKGTELVGKAVSGLGNMQAKLAGQNTGNNGGEVLTGEVIAPDSQQLWNAIGRTEGSLARDDSRASDYIQNAYNGTLDGTLDGSGYYAGTSAATPVANTTALTSTTTGSTLPSTSTATTSPYSSLEQERAIYFYRPTGQYWPDMLSQAMRNASNAGDYEALGELYEMYQQALVNAAKSTSNESSEKLTDKQRQANAALVALNDFLQEEHNFAYDVSDIPAVGWLANLGGNNYASKAEALALQVGYMLSGATVNREEAKNIGMAYVPQPRDNEAVRRSKLAQLRGIISEYQKTYAG